MTAQPPNCFVFCVVAVEFSVNGNQDLEFNDSYLTRLISFPGYRFGGSSFLLTILNTI